MAIDNIIIGTTPGDRSGDNLRNGAIKINSNFNELNTRINEITASVQISGSNTDISSLNTFTSSIQNEVDNLTSETSSYTMNDDYLSTSASFQSQIDGIVAGGSGADWNVNLINIPSGLISGSSQLTSDFDTRYTLSGSVSDVTLPSGLISGSTQITNGSTILSGSKTDISQLNLFTSSIQTEVDGLSSVTSSYLTELPSGLVSGSVQILGGSTILSGSKTNIIQLNSFTSSIQNEVDTLTASTGSYLTSLPSGLISGSTQIEITESQISDLSHTDITELNSFSSSIDTIIDNYITNNLTKTSKITLSSTAGVINWTGAEGNLYEIILTEDTVINNPSTPVDGASYTFRVKQDGTGLWVLTFGSNWKFPNGTTPSITLDPNAKDYITVIVDGTDLDAVEVQNFL